MVAFSEVISNRSDSNVAIPLSASITAPDSFDISTSNGTTTCNFLTSTTTLDAVDAWWRAANYLSVGQIYLLDNPLLERGLVASDIKPRLLGQWGTTPAPNFIYAHLNRFIIDRDLNVVYIAGPGHGGPGVVANAWLDGTYSELFTQIPFNRDGLRQLFRQFFFPGGIPRMLPQRPPGQYMSAANWVTAWCARMGQR